VVVPLVRSIKQAVVVPGSRSIFGKQYNCQGWMRVVMEVVGAGMFYVERETALGPAGQPWNTFHQVTGSYDTIRHPLIFVMHSV